MRILCKCNFCFYCFNLFYFPLLCYSNVTNMSITLRKKKIHSSSWKSDQELKVLDSARKKLREIDDLDSKEMYKVKSLKFNSIRDKKYLIGYSYYLDISKPKRHAEYLNIHIYIKGPKKDSPARRKEKQRIAESVFAQRQIESISSGTAYTPTHLKAINFFDFAQNFIDTYQKKDKRMIISCRNKFREFYGSDNLKLIDVTPSVMLRFKSYLENDKALSGETPSNYWTRFKKILKDAKVKGLINEMPTIDIRFSNPNKGDKLSKEILDIEELRILAKTRCGNETVKNAFLFCCYTGLGLAEIKNLYWSNIKKGRLIINRQKTGATINNGLNPAIIELMGRPGPPDHLIFDIQISDTAIKKNLKNWLKRAEIEKDISFYCARHSFACLLLMNGANLKSVADAMGHSSTKTTLKYLNYVDRLKDEAINNLPSFK